MARPTQNLTARLNLRLTPQEKELLLQEADRAAVDVSTLARAQLAGAPIPRRARRCSADHTMLARVLAQLGKVGGNLNQIAKVANTYGDLAAVSATQELKAELALIRQMVRKALAP